MSEKQTIGSAWPDQLYLYKQFTDEPTSQPPGRDFTLKSLEPPSPTDPYTIFDQRWQVHEQLQPLSELRVKQLFPSEPIDRIQELKKLNSTLIVQFLDLLDILYGERIENIGAIFINIHHILN
ncbi:mediator complex, subunit Med7 [Fennellomyces sp. T-0311]|nr:mediator complex, subunit Med7 [Fennellomyces sp. T-0311]